jgi:hypothetical protein
MKENVKGYLSVPRFAYDDCCRGTVEQALMKKHSLQHPIAATII